MWQDKTMSMHISSSPQIYWSLIESQIRRPRPCQTGEVTRAIRFVTGKHRWFVFRPVGTMTTTITKSKTKHKWERRGGEILAWDLTLYPWGRCPCLVTWNDWYPDTWLVETSWNASNTFQLPFRWTGPITCQHGCHKKHQRAGRGLASIPCNHCNHHKSNQRFKILDKLQFTCRYPHLQNATWMSVESPTEVIQMEMRRSFGSGKASSVPGLFRSVISWECIWIISDHLEHLMESKLLSLDEATVSKKSIKTLAACDNTKGCPSSTLRTLRN